MKKYSVKIPIVVMLEAQVFADDAEEAVDTAFEEGINFRVENDDNCNLLESYTHHDEIIGRDIHQSGSWAQDVYTLTAKEIAHTET